MRNRTPAPAAPRPTPPPRTWSPYSWLTHIQDHAATITAEHGQLGVCIHLGGPGPAGHDLHITRDQLAGLVAAIKDWYRRPETLEEVLSHGTP